MINKLTLIGRCGKDVRLGTTQKGINFATVSIATGAEPNTVWFDVIAFDKQSEWLAKAKKGTLVYVEGPVSLSSYQAKDGTTRTDLKVNAYVIRLLERVPDNAVLELAPNAAPSQKQITDFDYENELPF